ncbi:MAG TPA: rhomboid family intramembrane serine protease [Kofleriaceae bacterium]|jgi:membrane associated rhomboid family serine protease|nr:rhomboid family intramembrane serine protease [Kofleriaceae bacterium]
MRITRGPLIVLGLEVGFSLVWLAGDDATRRLFAQWLMATPANVFEHGRVWTLATGVFIEPKFLALLLHILVMWMFIPTLERFWGTARFYRFVAITSLVGTAAGCGVGYAIGQPGALVGGLDPFIYAAIVAFGIVYARQPVQFFGVLPLTGRQLMYGILVFLALLIVLSQRWPDGAAYAAAMLAAALLTSKRWSPSLAWKRWRIARARARLTVMSGGKARSSPPRDEHKWLN